MPEKTIIERAYELARTGPCLSVEEIRHQLRKECYTNITEHLSGLSIRRQLSALMRKKVASKTGQSS